METKVYDTENGEHVEETKDPNGNFYQKKVTKQGPGGVQSVSIMTSTSIGGGGGPAGLFQEMNRMMSMFAQMAGGGRGF